MSENQQVGTTDQSPVDNNLRKRGAINKVEEALRSNIEESVGIVTTHHFGGGCCSREMFLPAGTLAVGKIHRHEYINIILKGTVIITTEYGDCTVEGPCTWVGKSGTKAAAYAVTDVLWSNVFRADTMDLRELEEIEIVESYEKLEYEWERGITPRPEGSKDVSFVPFKDEDGSWFLNKNLKVSIEGIDSNKASDMVEKLLLNR